VLQDPKKLDILAQAVMARDSRTNWLTLWQECRNIFYPDVDSFVGDENPGLERRANVFTSLPELARRGLSTAIGAMTRPEDQRWFRAKPKRNELAGNESVRLWLDLVTSITYQALYHPKANMVAVMMASDAGVTTFGTDIVKMGWDIAGKHLTYINENIKCSVLMQDKFGHIDGCAIFKTCTLRQIISMFGEDKLTDRMKEKLRSGKQGGLDLEQKFELCNVCMPSEDYARRGFAPGRFPFTSLWFSVDCREILDDTKGYWDFPYMVRRWETFGNETYGRSPAMTALNDARALLAMEQTFLDAGEMAVRPPLGAWGHMIRGDVNLVSGGLTLFESQGYAQSGPPIWPIETGEIPKQVLEYMAVKQERVEAAFFRDILELPKPDAEKMTAAEINARHEQYMRQAGPVFARLENNTNVPLVEYAFNTLMREGMFPPPPKEMWEQEVEFEYEGPLKMARDRAEALKVMEGLGMIQQLAGGMAPEQAQQVQDNFDVDVIARYIGMKADLPQMLFKPLDTMLAEREDRAKQMKQMQMAEMASKLGPAIGQIGGAAAKAKQVGMLGSDAPLPINLNEFDPQAISDGMENTDFGQMVPA
jgi:hypothetical protein